MGGFSGEDGNLLRVSGLQKVPRDSFMQKGSWVQVSGGLALWGYAL